MSNDKVVKNIPYFFLFLLSFYPLMKSGVASVIAILFLLSTLIIYRSNFRERIKNLGYRPFLINCGFYILILFSVLYSDDFFIGFKKVQASLLILFFPIVFLYFFPKINNTNLYYLLSGFIFSSFILVMYFFNILVEGLEIDRFANLSEASFIDQLRALNTYPYEFVLSKAEKHLTVSYESHKVYVSLHFLVAIIMAGRLILKAKLRILTKILLGILILIFSTAIIYTQAITTVLAMAMVFLAFPFVVLKRKTHKLIYIASIALICGFGWSSGSLETYKNKNTASVLKLFQSFTNSNAFEGAVDKRYYIYKCSATLINERMLFGHGVGNVQNRLNKCYDDNKYVVAEFKSVGKDINSHNYYLNILLSAGIVAFISFLLFLFHSMRLALSTGNYVYLFFLIVMAISLLTENILVRMSGVFLFAIFNSVFYSISIAHVKRK